MDANNSVTKEILKKSNITALIISLIAAAAIAGWYATGAFEIAQEDLEAIKKNVAQSRQLAQESLKKADETLKKTDESLKHQQITDAWQILTTRAPGNSGKKDAIETLLAAGHKLTGIDLSSETHGGSVFLRNLQAANANLLEANLEGADLERANLKRAYLEQANLKGADLKRAILKGAYLEQANLKGANLKGADLKRAKLEGANLEGAYLKRANLKGANLEKANLSGTRFFGADISGADFEGAENLDLAKWSEDDGTAPAFALKTNPPKNLPPEILEKIELLGDEEYQTRKREWLQEWLQLDYE